MSVMNSLRAAGAQAALASSPADLFRAKGVIVPGVGHFGAAKSELDARGLTPALLRAAADGVPMLGICLGLQLFLDSSEESPADEGLRLLDGTVERLRGGGRKLPHIGWTSVERTRGLLGGMDGEYFYFVHSFAAHSACSSAVAAYGEEFDAAVERDNVCAVQFHPEKSGRAGLEVLRRFSGRCR